MCPALSPAAVAARIASFPPLSAAVLAIHHRVENDRIAKSHDLACVLAAVASPKAASLACEADALAGLVPSKTSLDAVINFSPSAVAERRVNRLKRSVWASGHLHGIADNGFRPAVPWFVTLTYAEANAWSPKHLSKAVQGYRNWCISKGYPCRYTWVAEIQPRRLERTGDAVVHYHLLAWLPVGVSMPHWDKPTRKRNGQRAPFWPHGMTNTEKAKSGVGYLMKYLSKLGELTRFPKGLRLYGIGGLNADGKNVRRWYNLPAWVKVEFGVGDVIRKAGRLVVKATGELLECPYICRLIPGGMTLEQIRPIPERWYAGAYSVVAF